MGCWGHAPLSQINPGKSLDFNKGRFMERQNPAAPWNNRAPCLGISGSLPRKSQRSPLCSFPCYSHPKIMEMVLVVPSSAEFQAPKKQREDIPKEKVFPKSLFPFFGLFPSCFLAHPGSSGRAGRRSRDSRLRGRGWVTPGTFQGVRKTGISSASRAHAEPRLAGNWDLGGGSGKEGGHGSGSAPSAPLGDVFLGIRTPGMSKLPLEALSP